MIRRFYIDGYRCFQNFELKLSDAMKSIVIVGKNGSGKSTLLNVLRIFQRMANGENSVDELISENDISFRESISQTSKPIICFILEIELDGKLFSYEIAFDWLDSFNGADVRRFRILRENLLFNGKKLFVRDKETITLSNENRSVLTFDWHRVWFSNYQHKEADVLKKWLSDMILLSPNPQLMQSAVLTAQKTLDYDGSNIIPWFKNRYSLKPEFYVESKNFLKETVFPDLESIDCGNADHPDWMVFSFRKEKRELKINFDYLSDGQKIFVLAAAVHSYLKKIRMDALCFWDEMENYVENREKQQLVRLIRAACKKGQFMFTTHSEENLAVCSENDALILMRSSFMEPVQQPIVFKEKIKKDGFPGHITDAIEFSEKPI